MAEPQQIHKCGVSNKISYGITNIPSKKDEDCSCVNMSHEAQGVSGVSSFGIFDGHDGKHAAMVCAAELNNSIVARYSKLLSLENSHPSNDDGLAVTDRLFFSSIEQCTAEIDFNIRVNMEDGSTMVSLFLIERADGSTRVVCPWVGDSRCILCQYTENGDVNYMTVTEDHNLMLPRELERLQKKITIETMPSATIRILNKGAEALSASVEYKVNDYYLISFHLFITVHLKVHVTTRTCLDPSYEIQVSNPVKRDTSFVGRRKETNELAVFGIFDKSLAMSRSIGDRYGNKILCVTFCVSCNSYSSCFLLSYYEGWVPDHVSPIRMWLS